MALRLNLTEWQKKWMGKQVEYTEVFFRSHTKDENSGKERVEWEKRKLETPLRGIVVGVRWLLNGVIVRPFIQRNFLGQCEEYEPGGLEEDQPRTLCYLVVPYPTRNYIRVPPESVKLLDEPT